MTDYPTVVAHYPGDYSANYCRNPDNDPNGPWCYSTDFTAPESQKMMYCDIPKCPDSDSKPPRRSKCQTSWTYYKGDNFKSESGETCLNWSDVDESASFARFQKFGVPRHNKCRNPSKDGAGPWCFVKKTVWRPRFQEKIVKESCAFDVTDKFDDCDIGCLDDDIGANYNGTAFVSGMGYICQKWNANYPNVPNSRYSDMDHNYCRNPDNDPNGPWCYIFSFSLSKAYCNQIPYCDERNNNQYRLPAQVTVAPSTDVPDWQVTESTGPSRTTSRSTTKAVTNQKPPSCGNLVYPQSRSWWKKTTDLSSRYSQVEPTYNTHNLDRTKRIYGGEKAPGMVPWLASFVFGDENSNTKRCGASIIGPNFVITAAHCAYNQTIDSIKIVGGTFSSSASESHAIEIKPLKIMIHPDYDTRKNSNDIALVRVERIRNWPDSMRPICLPDENDSFKSGSLCMVAGWGATEEANVSPYVSQFSWFSVIMYIFSQNTLWSQNCPKRFAELGFTPQWTITKNFAPAGNKEHATNLD